MKKQNAREKPYILDLIASYSLECSSRSVCLSSGIFIGGLQGGFSLYSRKLYLFFMVNSCQSLLI